MASLIYSCVLFIICASLAHAAVDTPCNDEKTDCGHVECCAVTTGAPQGFKGVCQKYATLNEPCTPGGPKEGECGCMSWMRCARFLIKDQPEKDICQFIMP